MRKNRSWLNYLLLTNCYSISPSLIVFASISIIMFLNATLVFDSWQKLSADEFIEYTASVWWTAGEHHVSSSASLSALSLSARSHSDDQRHWDTETRAKRSWGRKKRQKKKKKSSRSQCVCEKFGFFWSGTLMFLLLCKNYGSPEGQKKRKMTHLCSPKNVLCKRRKRKINKKNNRAVKLWWRFVRTHWVTETWDDWENEPIFISRHGNPAQQRKNSHCWATLFNLI